MLPIVAISVVQVSACNYNMHTCTSQAKIVIPLLHFTIQLTYNVSSAICKLEMLGIVQYSIFGFRQ